MKELIAVIFFLIWITYILITSGLEDGKITAREASTLIMWCFVLLVMFYMIISRLLEDIKERRKHKWMISIFMFQRNPSTLFLFKNTEG